MKEPRSRKQRAHAACFTNRCSVCGSLESLKSFHRPVANSQDSHDLMHIIDAEEDDVRLNGKRAHRVLDPRMLSFQHIAVRKYLEKLDRVEDPTDHLGG